MLVYMMILFKFQTNAKEMKQLNKLLYIIGGLLAAFLCS